MVGHIENVPTLITNWINGDEVIADDDRIICKLSPTTGQKLFDVVLSSKIEVSEAVNIASEAQFAWGECPAVERGNILYQICNLLEQEQAKIAKVVALETGKSIGDAIGETAAAISLGRFFAGEGQRLYGRTTTSSVKGKEVYTIRQPCGVAGLIVSANTPIANLAWKVFPALICGNSVVLKASEDAPATAWIFSKIVHEAGLPSGLFNVVNGTGAETGAALVQNHDINVLSFTGSTAVGKWIAAEAATRLLKISLELGGKNPLLVCNDAELINAVKWVCLSAFSNSGQRCASASRIIVMAEIYDDFKIALQESISNLKICSTNLDDLGPVINERQLNNMLREIDNAVQRGAKIICGGKRIEKEGYSDGYFIEPTLIENVSEDDALSNYELFGPIATLYKVADYKKALQISNNSDYGLTSCIHTRNIDRAMHFVRHSKAGMTVINAGTYGSEPHMPFGGVNASGNGSREPGSEALDVYTELKSVCIQTFDNNIN